MGNSAANDASGSHEFGPEELFAAAVAEAYKDGELQSQEIELLGMLQRIFSIPDAVRDRLEEEALERFRKNELGTRRPLSPLRLYENCLKQVFADGVVSPQENALVQSLGKVLRISQEEHKKCLDRVKEYYRRLRPPADEPAPPEPVPTPPPAPPVPSPPPPPAVSEARAATNRVVFALNDGKTAEAMTALDPVRAAYKAKPTPENAREYAVALECLVDYNFSQQSPFLDYPPLDDLIQEALKLYRKHGADREVARAFTNMSGGAEIAYLIVRNGERLADLLNELKDLLGRFRGDEELVFNVARGLVNAAIVRDNQKKEDPREASRADELTTALKATLEAATRSCPQSEKVADARGRFSRVTGLAVQAPAGAAKVAPAPGPARPAGRRRSSPIDPEVRAIQRLFQQFQDANGAPAFFKQLLEVLGTGPYLPRVMRDGERVYAADENYFLELLEVIAWQLENDRCGFWHLTGGRLEMMTRYLVEDATPRIARAANDLRKQLGLEEV